MGVVERYLFFFAQLYAYNQAPIFAGHNIDSKTVSSHNSVLNHIAWLYSTDYYDTRTAKHHVRGTGKDHTQNAIPQFGEKVHIDNLMGKNVKLYHRNQQQEYEALWSGRDTAAGQHATL
eukprot:6463844-Amphidinium_carterae.1